MSLSDLLRLWFKNTLEGIARVILQLGISPNSITLLGLMGNLIASVFITLGMIQIGGLIVLIMGPLDAVDGTVARIGCGETKFGAFLDSISDRYSEFFILGSLLVIFLRSNNWQACILVYIAAAGSLLVSYTRAKAESLGYSAKIGVLTRVERYLVMAPALILNVPMIGLWIIAVFANFTALQRIWQVWRQVKNENQNKKNSLEKARN